MRVNANPHDRPGIRHPKIDYSNQIDYNAFQANSRTKGDSMARKCLLQRGFRPILVTS